MTTAAELLVKQRTQLVNAVRGHAAEFGVIAAKGAGQAGKLLERLSAEPAIPPEAASKDQLPPLLQMEALLFRILLAAFVLLTLTVVSGVFFSEQLFGKPFTLTSKTFFAILSWLIFGGLLAGHFVRGWRGRTAVRWTLAGFSMLLLAYVGSKFVLEVVLDRA